jgi:hypothetical protein
MTRTIALRKMQGLTSSSTLSAPVLGVRRRARSGPRAVKAIRRQTQNRALRWVGGWALDVCDAVCDHVKSKPKYCPALSNGAIVGIVIACVVVVAVVVGILVYFFVIKPKKAAVAPDQQAPTSGPTKPYNQTPSKLM